MDLTEAQKKIIEIYEKGYRVINGEIFNPEGKILKGSIKNSNGMKYIYFHPIKSFRAIPTHRLVAFQKFGYEMFRKGLVVRHLDGNSLNNKEENIGLGSHSDNMMDKSPELRSMQAMKATIKNRKFSDSEIEEIRRRHNSGESYSTLMKEYGVTSKGTMSYIINHKYKTNK